MDNKITLYGCDLTTEKLKQLWSEWAKPFNGKGYIIAELFDRNLLVSADKAQDITTENLISSRFFDGEKQIKLRRIRNDLFWAASDFDPGGFSKLLEKAFRYDESRKIILWGDLKKCWGFFYEERIPYFFADPLGGSLEEGDRLSVSVREYRDKLGVVIWDRFESIQRWQG